MAGEQEQQEHTDFKIVFQCFVPGIQGPWHPGVSRFLHVVGTLSLSVSVPLFVQKVCGDSLQFHCCQIMGVY